jgi:hypothetical protein
MAGIDLVGAASFSGADQLLDMGAPKFEGRGALGKVLGPHVDRGDNTLNNGAMIEASMTTGVEIERDHGRDNSCYESCDRRCKIAKELVSVHASRPASEIVFNLCWDAAVSHSPQS